MLVSRRSNTEAALTSQPLLHYFSMRCSEALEHCTQMRLYVHFGTLHRYACAPNFAGAFASGPRPQPSESGGSCGAGHRCWLSERAPASRHVVGRGGIAGNSSACANKQATLCGQEPAAAAEASGNAEQRGRRRQRVLISSGSGTVDAEYRWLFADIGADKRPSDAAISVSQSQARAERGGLHHPSRRRVTSLAPRSRA